MQIVAEVSGRAPLIVAILLGVATQAAPPARAVHASRGCILPAVPRAPALPVVATIEPGCEILEFGPYLQIGSRRYFDDAGAVTGRSFEVDEVDFIEHTTTITRKLRTGFGMRYQVHDLAAGSSVTWRVKYPRKIHGVADWIYDPSLVGDHSRAILYDFDHAWEMVPGRWEFSVLVDGKATCGLAFTVK